MKLATPISILALVLASAALFNSLSQQNTQPSDEELDRLVDAALSRKEKIYVESLAPKLDRIYQDMLGPRYQTPEKPPETLGELFAPAINIVNNLTSGQ
jgi:hypothetical protein